MFEALTTYHLIIIFSITIIISYFFNIYAKKSGIPAVLLLIGLGIGINYALRFSGFPKPDLLPVLEVLGVVGLILIVLEAALDLQLLKEKIGLIVKSFLVALIGLAGTAYLAALALNLLMEVEVLNALLYTIPLSILSSAIILPSIDDLDEDKREFMIYESTFSDIVGIIGFYSVLTMVGSSSGESVYGEVFGNLALTVIFSVIISYILIYIFQNIKGHVKLFLLIAILLLLYAVGKMLHMSSLLIILIFGMILNNYKVFFKGGLMKLLNVEKVEEVLGDMKVITAETAFVVRTFFFIIFGWSVYLGSLLSFKVIGIGLVILTIIYIVRAITLFIFNGKDVNPQLFLAPRGLITILLFFAIPKELSIGAEFQGVLLFVILVSCLVMTWSLISYKNKLAQIGEYEDEELLGEKEIEEKESEAKE
ncbi:cation:proton antiporter [Flavobacteriales bacterium]|nr:cation:proton antiporter [Flavobacteriales bacterium]MDG1348637.1 cation:proton antiporter [Flavobacteriales bacterium]